MRYDHEETLVEWRQKKNLFQCHFIYHTSHMQWSGMNPGLRFSLANILAPYSNFTAPSYYQTVDKYYMIFTRVIKIYIKSRFWKRANLDVLMTQRVSNLNWYFIILQLKVLLVILIPSDGEILEVEFKGLFSTDQSSQRFYIKIIYDNT